MEIIRDLAIVLKVIRFEERHQIVTALTENHGKITVIARNSVQSRRFGGSLDLFCAADWIYQVKPTSNLALLQEASTRESYSKLPQDFQRLACASTFNEVLLMIEAGSEHSQGLFRHHAHALWLLQSLHFPNNLDQSLILLNLYLLKILIWTGNVPQLEECLNCSRAWDELDLKSSVYGDIARAGWTCSHCEIHQKTFEISVQTLSDILKRARESLKSSLHNLACKPKQYTQFLRFLEAFYIFHIPGFDQKPLKSLKFVLDSTPT